MILKNVQNTNYGGMQFRFLRITSAQIINLQGVVRYPHIISRSLRSMIIARTTPNSLGTLASVFYDCISELGSSQVQLLSQQLLLWWRSFFLSYYEEGPPALTPRSGVNFIGERTVIFGQIHQQHHGFSINMMVQVQIARCAWAVVSQYGRYQLRQQLQGTGTVDKLVSSDNTVHKYRVHDATVPIAQRCSMLIFLVVVTKDK